LKGSFVSGRAIAMGVCAVLCVIVAGCNSSPTSPSAGATFSQTDLVVGTGAEAASGKALTVHYTGWLYDASSADKKGLQFETSRGGDPFKFLLGVGSVIEGWDRGLPGTKTGGLRRLIIPPSLAYGSTRNGPIPPDAALVFEIELLAVE
jgi:FKBP-type peptidyl-prolyl cis-trans isomerase FkpA